MPKSFFKKQKFHQKSFTLHDLPKEERPRDKLKIQISKYKSQKYKSKLNIFVRSIVTENILLSF